MSQVQTKMGQLMWQIISSLDTFPLLCNGDFFLLLRFFFCCHQWRRCTIAKFCNYTIKTNELPANLIRAIVMVWLNTYSFFSVFLFQRSRWNNMILTMMGDLTSKNQSKNEASLTLPRLFFSAHQIPAPFKSSQSNWMVLSL